MIHICILYFEGGAGSRGLDTTPFDFQHVRGEKGKWGVNLAKEDRTCRYYKGAIWKYMHVPDVIFDAGFGSNFALVNNANVPM